MRESESATFEDLDMCLAAVPAGATDTLTALVATVLAEARMGLEEVWDQVAKCHGPGEPFELWDVALTWADVAKLLTDQAARLEQGRFPATHTWQGPESHVYRALLPHQQHAAEQVATAVTSVSDVLTRHAAKVISAWLDLFDRLTSFGLQLSDDACRFVSAEPVEWPGLAQRMLVEIRQAEGSVRATSEQLKRLALDADEQWSDLMQQCERFLSSAGGGWPQLPAM